MPTIPDGRTTDGLPVDPSVTEYSVDELARALENRAVLNDGLVADVYAELRRRVIAAGREESIAAQAILEKWPTLETPAHAAAVDALKARELRDAELEEEAHELTEEEAAAAVAGHAEAQRAEELAELELLNDDVAGAEPTDRDYRELLVANGFGAIRAQVLGVVQGAGAIPEDTVRAGIDHMRSTIARLKLSNNPRAGEALHRAELELDAFRAFLHFRKALGKADERAAAREAITTGVTR